MGKTSIAKEAPKASKSTATKATSTKKAVEKTVETKKVTTKKPSPTVKKPTEQLQPEHTQAMSLARTVGDTVIVVLDGKECNASITGIHHGNRIDAVVLPNDGPNFSLGSVEHESIAKAEPFWK